MLALALIIVLPAAALAQDASDEPAWPSTDALRAELQAIGYGFTFDGAGRARLPAFESSLPALWTLTEPVIEGDDLPDGAGLEPFTLQLIDDGSGAVQLLFAGTSADDGVGELDAIATALMEIEARLPDGNGLDEVVWFLGNKWQAEGERSAAPCVYRDSNESVMVAWFGGEGEDITSFFGTVGTSAVLPDELELCKQALAQPQAPATDPDDEGTSDAATVDAGVDFGVSPAEAVEIIEAGTHTVIDVRTPAEFEQAHVVGAINIDVEAPDFAERIAELDPDEPYLLYCRTGRRSDLAAQQMAAAGFSDITDGAGLADLARAGAPVE
ncbi:MAG: rhodanese-like domain-containing protein [Candidatus Limnocylindrales bacterium]